MQNVTDRYTQIESTLALAQLEALTPSELHGTLVGAIANHLKSGIAPDLLKLIEPDADPGDGRFAPLNELLHEIYRDTSEVLFETKEGFDLVLPSDDEPVEVRVEAIATWSKGYLLGLLYNDAFSIDQLPENGAEIVRDFMQIAEVAADGSEEDEKNLFELQEFIKVAAQLIFEHIYSERAAEPPSQQH